MTDAKNSAAHKRMYSARIELEKCYPAREGDFTPLERARNELDEAIRDFKELIDLRPDQASLAERKYLKEMEAYAASVKPVQH